MERDSASPRDRAAASTPVAPALRLRGVSFAYAGQAALRNISLDLEPGSVLVLAGANGSGKSTLLALLAGLLSPARNASEPPLTVMGLPSPGQERAIRRAARLVMQDADLQIIGATVEEDLLLGARPDEATRERALSLASAFGLADKLGAPVQALSYGQKRKLCLAGALLAAPRLLLLDEPFSGLDYPGMLELRRIIERNRRDGLTQAISAHDLEPVIDLADKLAVLKNGELAAFGPPADVLDRALACGVRPPCSWLARGEITPWEAPGGASNG